MGNLLVNHGSDQAFTSPTIAISPGAHVQPPAPKLRAGWPEAKSLFSGPEGCLHHEIASLRLAAGLQYPDLGIPCGVQAGKFAVLDRSGRVAIPVATGPQFPLRNPLGGRDVVFHQLERGRRAQRGLIHARFRHVPSMIAAYPQ